METTDDKKQPKVTKIEGKTYDSNFFAKPGEYHMVSLDKEGNEIKGSDFSIGVTSYERAYKNNTSFKVKKSPNE